MKTRVRVTGLGGLRSKFGKLILKSSQALESINLSLVLSQRNKVSDEYDYGDKRNMLGPLSTNTSELAVCPWL